MQRHYSTTKLFLTFFGALLLVVSMTPCSLAQSQLSATRRQAEAEIVEVWNQLIDPVIAAHAQPTGINKGTLFVTVDSSPWLSEIVRYRRKEIIDRLQNSFGKEMIARISFRLG